VLPYLKLAFRNIFRFKRRTFITFLATSVGLSLLIVTISLMNGIDKDSISNIINCQTSHIKIFAQGYHDKLDDYPLDPAIEQPEKRYSTLLEIPGVKAVESRILFGATLINGVDELPCLGVAVETDRDPDLFKIKESILEGDWLEPADSQILLGVDLARDLRVKVGDRLTLRLITSTDKKNFSWNAVDVEIKGIFESGDPNVDRGRIFIPMAAAREELGMTGRATEIVVRLNGYGEKRIEEVQQQIVQSLNGDSGMFQAYSWKQLASGFLAVSKMKTKNSGIVIFVMLLIASVGIVNTMLMTVMERTREIGMLAAMGLKRREILRLFVYEGGMIGLIGSLLGCILGGLFSWYLQVKGFSLTAWGETMQRMSEAVYPVKGVFYADLSFGVLIMVFLFGTAIALLGSYLPARRAARMDPIRALRHI